MRIPIVFATDENYLFYTCVAITSLAKYAAADTEYDIYILMEESSHNIYFDKVDKRYSNIHIEVINVQASIFKNVIINNKHITKATFYRLTLSELLDVDKCIYLDSDIIATDDLADLFNVNVEEYYIAGCRDIWIAMLSEEDCEVRRRGIGQIPSMEEYINAGVMVMNLRKIREDGLNRKFIEQLSVNYLYEDQDIINVCCYGKIRHLSARWNIYSPFLSCLEEMQKNGINEQVLKDFQSKKGIIHYATPMIRPWENFFCWANKEWWDVASEWKEEDFYQSMESRVQKKSQENQWEYYVQKCKEHKKVVVFGFTYYGRQVCNWLLNSALQNKLIFCDNNPEKEGLSYQGIHVVPLDEIEKDEVLFINCSQRRSVEVTEMLLNYGIKREDIICYQQKSWEYYQYMDERYYLSELKDIFYREHGSALRGFRENLDEMRNELLRNSEYKEWHDRYFMRSWILKGK